MTTTLEKKLHPQVLALCTSGRLSAFDAEWIAGLRKEAQLAAAEKCIRGNLSFGVEGRAFRGKGTFTI